jgi:hypothetical protein
MLWNGLVFIYIAAPVSTYHSSSIESFQTNRRFANPRIKYPRPQEKNTFRPPLARQVDPWTNHYNYKLLSLCPGYLLKDCKYQAHPNRKQDPLDDRRVSIFLFKFASRADWQRGHLGSIWFETGWCVNYFFWNLSVTYKYFHCRWVWRAKCFSAEMCAHPKSLSYVTCATFARLGSAHPIYATRRG